MNDDEEWSIEILDGDCTTNSSSTSKESHPLFLNDFSTKASVSGTRPSAHEKAKRTLHAHPSSPLIGVSHSTSSVETRRLYSTIPAAELESPQLRIIESQAIQLARCPSSSSSTQNIPKQTNEEEKPFPVYSFMEYEDVPVVKYIKSESEANHLVQTLRGPLGFDLEWRVMWHPGAQERRTALVQLCDRHTILLIQVSNMKKFPRKVMEVIESEDVVKTGVSILNDGEKLYRDFGIRAKGLVELGTLATSADDRFRSVYDRDIVSLAKIVAMYLGRTLRKGKVRTSNWEADLSRSMVDYAANDCHCALMVYDKLQDIAQKDGKKLDISSLSCHVTPRPPKQKPSELPLQRSLSQTHGPTVPDYCIPEPPRPQQLRAYKLWHVDKMRLDQMCMKLRLGDRIEPLKESTVISYVVGALQADPRLPFNMDDLKTLVRMEASSWQRHREWIASRE